MLFAAPSTSLARAATSSQRCIPCRSLHANVVAQPCHWSGSKPWLRPSRAGHCFRSPAPGGVQQQSAQRATLADRTITVLSRPTATQRQFARVLNDHDIAVGNPCGCARSRMAYHLASRHSVIAQKAREPHLLRPSSRKPTDTRAGALDKRRMQGGPPFSSGGRRTAPAKFDRHVCLRNQYLTHGISPPNYRQSRCVHTIAACGERVGVRGYNSVQPG